MTFCCQSSLGTLICVLSTENKVDVRVKLFFGGGEGTMRQHFRQL